MKKLIILGIILAICTACGGGSSSVNKAISQVEKAVEKVEKNKGKMTDEDWRNLEKEVEAPLKVIAEALDNDKVGIISKMKILAVTAKWATVLAEAGVKELEKKSGVAMEDWAKELEKAAKDIEQAAKEFESEHGSDLEKAIKELENSDLVKALEQAAQELQKNAAAASE